MKTKRILCAISVLALLASSAACSAGSSAGSASGTPTNAAENGTKSVASDDKTAPTTDKTAPTTDDGGKASEKAELAVEGEASAAAGLEFNGSSFAADSAIKSSDSVIASDSVGKTFDYAERATMDAAGEFYGGEAISPSTIKGEVGFEETAPAPGYYDDDYTDIVPDDFPEYDPPVQPGPGLLTAGEWKDNTNWGFFCNLVNAGTVEFPSFGLDPRFRTAVTVKSAGGSPVINAKVRLLDKDNKVIWKAVTDKDGVAYLFTTENDVPVMVEAESDGKTERVELEQKQRNQQQTSKIEANDVSITLDAEGVKHKKTEIMFIVDTTGSMADEMLFLQSEFGAIAKEVGTQDTTYSVNFYRDEGDDYVTKCFDFTDDIEDIQKKLNAETADGGGDTPEAVDQILKETLTDGKWSDDTVKIAFLIFDAPPHYGKEQVLIEAVRSAAEKGIRLIPVVSSNSERETELFGRALAIQTGGTYVFLTDDSGIGGSHLEPIIGDYEVEKLYDIIIRVINEYKQ